MAAVPTRELGTLSEAVARIARPHAPQPRSEQTGSESHEAVRPSAAKLIAISVEEKLAGVELAGAAGRRDEEQEQQKRGAWRVALPAAPRAHWADMDDEAAPSPWTLEDGSAEIGDERGVKADVPPVAKPTVAEHAASPDEEPNKAVEVQQVEPTAEESPAPPSEVKGQLVDKTTM